MKVNFLCKFFGHKFGEWEYIADDSCEQVRVCQRDGYQESRKAPHQFGEWKYVADGSCKQVRVCKRDGYQESDKVFHQFGEWEYIADSSCEQVRVCKRDGYQETRKVHQQWLPYDDEYHQCHRCPDKESHDWIFSTRTVEEEEYIPDFRGFRTVEKEITEATCTKCGKER